MLIKTYILTFTVDVTLQILWFLCVSLCGNVFWPDLRAIKNRNEIESCESTAFSMKILISYLEGTEEKTL